MIGVNSVKKFEKNESIRKEAEFSHLKCFCYVYIKGMSKIEKKKNLRKNWKLFNFACD